VDLPLAKGPKGRFDPSAIIYWSDLELLEDKSAAKSLLAFLSTRESQDQLVTATTGFDLPVLEKLSDFKIYERKDRPRTKYNMVPRGDVIPSIVGPARRVEDREPQMWAQATLQDDRPVTAIPGKSIEAARTGPESEMKGCCGRRFGARSFLHRCEMMNASSEKRD